MNILIPTASRFIRPRNTDWRYAAQTLPSLSNYRPQLHLVTQRNLLADAESNVRYALSIARSRGFGYFPSKWAYRLEQDCPLYAGDAKKAKAEAILSYERYPSKSYGLPVAWIASPSDPEILEQLGHRRTDVVSYLAWKKARAEQAARMIFTTKVALDQFIAQNGVSLREKSSVIPFFIDGISAGEDTEKKWDDHGLRFLFIGREARRKGLPATLEALTPMLKDHPELTFTIVSSMDDGEVPLPQFSNIIHLRETGRTEVLELMSRSHVLIMPSSRESYGFVYIEAMSQSCLALALDKPVQRELIGPHGILVGSQDPEEIGAALRHVLAARDVYRAKARGGLDNFRAKHAPDQVAEQFLKLLSGMC